MEHAGWNRGMFLAVLLITMAGMSVVAAESRRERLFAVGMAVQAVLLAFVFNGAFHRRPELPAVAATLCVVFGLWCLMSDVRSGDESSSDATGSLGDSSQDPGRRSGDE